MEWPDFNFHEVGSMNLVYAQSCRKSTTIDMGKKYESYVSVMASSIKIILSITIVRELVKWFHHALGKRRKT